MLRLAASCLIVGLGSALYGLLAASPFSPVAQLVGLSALTLFLILAIVGTPSLRNLVG